jgi:hypothetical protein
MKLRNQPYILQSGRERKKNSHTIINIFGICVLTMDEHSFLILKSHRKIAREQILPEDVFQKQDFVMTL